MRTRPLYPVRQVSAARRQPRAADRLPFIPALVVFAVLAPEALGFIVADFRLTPARLVFLALAPVMLVSFSSLLGSARYRFTISDILLPLATFWSLFALSRTQGFGDALKSGGVTALEMISPYLLMRSLLNDVRQVHAIVRLFCILSALVGPLAIVDTLTNEPILHDSLARITGYSYFEGAGLARNLADNYRLGLFRAQGIFEHPILLGVVMCFALLLTRDLVGPVKKFCRIGCALGLFLSLSSAPWQGFLAGIGLMLFSRIFGFPHRWMFVVFGAAFAVGSVFMVTSNPWVYIFNYMTLDASTGYYRLLIWQYAGTAALESPLFGIGLLADWVREDWMGASIDSYWLVLALHYGIPCSIMTGLGLIGACSLAVRQTRANSGQIGPREVKLAETLGILMFLTVMLGFTVHFWGVSGMLTTLFAGMRAALGEIAAAKASRPILNEANRLVRAHTSRIGTVGPIEPRVVEPKFR